MDISSVFIKRPIGTTLLAIGLFLVGIAAYELLPIASLPTVDFPTIRVRAARPGADPATMAASVAAPLERRLSAISGVSEITSTSTLGSTSISVQFDLSRKVDFAARDVQAALNAAATDLPGDLPTLPSFRKANPNSFPVIILALTSDTIPTSAIYDAADTVLAQRLSQIKGVAEVNVTGAEQPAIRIRVDPARLTAMGLGIDQVRQTVASANVQSPVGSIDGRRQLETFATSDQINTPADYGRIVLKSSNGNVVQLSDVATIERGVRDTRAAGWFNGKPSVIVQITKQADANVIETVDRVKEQIPDINRWLPAGVDVSILSDRTLTIRESLADIKRTLLITVILVMMVVFVFLRRATPTLAAGVTVPLSLAGTFALMWLAGFSIDNLSLMAITISIGFVVDDAIVMIENIHRNLEAGLSRMEAAIVGAREIGFTIISISLSLIAAFIPMLFMDGIIGKFFQEFSYTLAFAIFFSTIVSLTLTPMICGHFMTRERQGKENLLGRIVEGGLSRAISFYSRTLVIGLKHPWFMLLVMLLTVGLTIEMFRISPKGSFPQDDTGLIFAFTEASPDVSFPAMATLQQQAEEIVLTDAAVAGTASSIGSSGFGGTVNQGRLFISLKPVNERGLNSQGVVARLRGKLSGIAGLRVFMVPVQDVRAGGRSSKSQYQFTLWDANLEELDEWSVKILERVKQIPGVVDASKDRDQGGLEAKLVINRSEASRMGVAIQDIDNVLSSAFGQRQISTIYGTRNQYRVIFEVSPSRQRDPSDITDLYVPGNIKAGGGTVTAAAQTITSSNTATSNLAGATTTVSTLSGGANMVPLGSLAKLQRGTSALAVNHQGEFPAITLTYNLTPETGIEAASDAIQKAVADMHPPDGIHAEFAGDAKAFQQGSGGLPLLILTALLAVYIILGVLYESFLHPLTIISTLPSAGLGALLALRIAGLELTIIAFIGIILLIGIVKKNGIMLVDFAVAAERKEGLSPYDAIVEACIARFRPILMTTLAALFGAIPLAIATGAGAELRRPLGITIVGGLILSQVLTLYTTPVIYLLMSKLQRRRRSDAPRAVPAE